MCFILKKYCDNVRNDDNRNMVSKDGELNPREWENLMNQNI